MFDRWAFLVLAAAGTPWAQPDSDAQTAMRTSSMQLHLDVSGPMTPDCAARVLIIPMSGGGRIHVEIAGVVYDGHETSSHLLVLRSNESRALSLSGDAMTGGRWSRGVDGRCVGTWRVSR